MSPLLYELVIYTIEAVISVTFLINLLQPKYNKILHIFIWCEIVLIIMLFTPSFSLVRVGVIALAEFVYTLFLYEDKLKKRLMTFIFKEIILLVSSLLSFAIYTWLIDEGADFLAIYFSDNCTYCLMYLLMSSVLFSIVLQFAREIRGVELPWVIGTQIVIGIGECTALLSVAISSSVAIDSSEARLIAIAMVFMVAANISISTLAPYLLRKVSMSNNIDFGKELSNMEYKYYEMSVENDKKLMSIKHDISNHIQTIYSLLESGESQRGIEIINELKTRYAMVDQMVYCNNPVVNIILSNKKSEAEEKGIEIQIRIKDSLDSIPITDFDLSTVICNLLDNAIRGSVCSEQTHPRLIVEILQKNRYLVIRVLNSCRITMSIESTDRIETTKSNSQTHGFGMPIVAGIAKKYRGDFVVSAQNGIFTATVVMSVK